jgi:HAD superfamily hydrolase (TIGR01548 family)
LTPTSNQRIQAILFDLDGVLVDVSCSYRRAIQQTVLFFTGKEATSGEIQQLKQQGGYNNDWDLTEAILKQRGKSFTKKQIINNFQELYLGTKAKPGLIVNEKWLLPKNQLEMLHTHYLLGIVTGRPKQETDYVLTKFRVEKFFNATIVMENYPAEKAKPDPYPVQLALEKLGVKQAVYIGDSVDDIVAAKRAGLKAIGCIPPGFEVEPLRSLLLSQGAEIVLNNISQISEVLQ